MKQILNAAGITVPEQVTAEKCKGDFLVCGGIEHRRWMAERALSGWQQSPFLKDGKPMRQEALLLHYDITDDIDDEKEKDELAVRYILMLDAILTITKQTDNENNQHIHPTSH